VTEQKSGTTVFTLLYDDGEVETLDLAGEVFKVLEDAKKMKKKVEKDKKNKVESRQEETQKSEEASRKRRIMEDSEEEFDMDDNESDGGSVYEDKPVEDEEEEEDSWMVTDDEENDIPISMNNSKRKLKVIPENNNPPNKKRKESKVMTPLATLAAMPSDDSADSRFLTPAAPSLQSKTSSSTKSSNKGAATKITPSPRPLPTPPAAPIPPSSSPPPFEKGVVNPAGAHFHNHLSFLQNPRDAQNRPPSDPCYDPRTLYINYAEMEKVQGSKLTPASKQWWEMKAMYADTLLFFKTGKFYEIFHMDADVAVSVLGFSYMKGVYAHAGFPEIGYGNFSSKLIAAGYKVARVEQTETPDMLKERQKASRVGQKPKVVNREVCSIMSAGTRTFCYLDDVKSLEKGDENGGGNVYGPLLAIQEVEVGKHEGEEGGGVKPVCEYGVTLVDAIRGVVTVGQFADDVLRSRMNTLLTTFGPSEVLIQGGENGASSELLSLLKSAQSTSSRSMRIERVNDTEMFPKSTAVDPAIRKQMERRSSHVKPWDVDETLQELHRRGYYPRSSRKADSSGDKISRWPEVLRACVNGGATLALSSFGAVLFYLQRSLIDGEILSMGIVKAYVPPGSPSASEGDGNGEKRDAVENLKKISAEEERKEDGVDLSSGGGKSCVGSGKSPSNHQEVDFGSMDGDVAAAIAAEAEIDHMSLDGTTLSNLEILTNSHSNTAAGSLWSKINHTKSPHGSRLLRAWLLRPLFRKLDIERRADAVEELACGGAAVAMSEARLALAKCGDIERLLSRVHSMGGAGSNGNNPTEPGYHPNERAVLYETVTHTRRKVGDFSRLLNGVRAAAQIPELFSGIDIQSGLLRKIVHTTAEDGCFPADLNERLDWFFDNFDCKRAAEGLFEPARGMDDTYDAACDTIERIEQDLEDYKNEMCNGPLQPSSLAKSSWKYANTKEGSKDKYLIELPVSVRVPADFYVKGKRGSGAKQVNKYRTPVVEQLVEELEAALDVQRAGKARGMQLVFAKFDSMRSIWAATAQATAMLDALGALAETAGKPGFCRPAIVDCPPNGRPCIQVEQGRHPCVEVTHMGGDFIPNNLSLGGVTGDNGNGGDASRVLLLSGPNMGGKSTLLRQTCLITILAQIGSYVPAEQCAVTPIDRIYTRLGASDRILMGQSTFFVELAETAAAVRGATRRSLVIMDELGRGTSTFDGTAIASAVVKHLVERNKCLALFATHYHSLLEDWKEEASVRLGHMECIVDGGDEDTAKDVNDAEEEGESTSGHNITFLYTLGDGVCPKSFGINVARLAGVPEEVLGKAKAVSSKFEKEMNGSLRTRKISPANAIALRKRIEAALQEENWEEAERLFCDLQ